MLPLPLLTSSEKIFFQVSYYKVIEGQGINKNKFKSPNKGTIPERKKSQNKKYFSDNSLEQDD